MYFSTRLKICFGLSVFFYTIFGVVFVLAIFKYAPESSTIALIILAMLYFIYSLIAPIIAIEKNRSGLGFFILSLIINPILAIAIVLIISPLKNND